MTQSELQQILCERIKIANDQSLSIKERQAEDKITQTILEVAQFVFDDNGQNAKTTQTDLNWNEKTEQLVISLSNKNEDSCSGKHSCRFGDEQKLWLIENFRIQPTITALTKEYNEHFNVNVSRCFIREKCKFYKFIK